MHPVSPPQNQLNAPKKVSIQPIADMQFAGLHWIEASAGTGKTYTLSSLMVRIFLEKYLPNQVIATTFTRKAAAELKSRIRARLQETYRYFDGCRSLTEQEILAKAAQENDPLFAKVLVTFATQTAYACERLKLVIDQLDELFVGTLDSFSQKLLREFAFESGKIERAEITDDAKSYTFQLIHDVLREWIQKQPQNMIDYLILNKKLKSQDAYVAVVENSLNFTSAKLQEIQPPHIDLSQFDQEVQDLLTLDVTQIESLSDFYLENGQHHKIIGKKWRDHGRMQSLLTEQLPRLIAAIRQQGIYSIFVAQHADTLKALSELTTKKVLNKCSEDILQSFEQNAVILNLKQFIEALTQLHGDLDTLDSYLQFHLASEVKKRLPQVLQQKGETTFAQQIRTLAESLQGEQGQRFASFIHARYPLILVDEFQDTNQDQDDMLAQIWRHPSRVKNGCMIMVGDRKQAIYGFRGGDMLTFLKAHQDVFGKDGNAYNLVYNHRSVQPLVEVVDALFQRQTDFGEQVFYTPVQAGSRPHPDLIDHGQINPTPLRWLQLEDKNTEAEQVAWKIRDLLNQAIQGELYFQEKNGNRALDENDIAILSKNHDGLDKAQSALAFLGIRTNRPAKKSVFSSALAQDVGAVLTAIMYPYDEAKVKRALLSRLIGFDLKKLIKLEQKAEGLSHYIEQFDLIREMWLKQGFLTAWQYALTKFLVWTNLVAKQSRDNERVVVNLRHLTELLSQHSERYQGAQNLYHWYLKQLTSPMEREWELERKLSNDAGVQLMTIHQSKGLEFKIVFLLGADKDFREPNKSLNFSTQETLNPQTGQIEQQRVVAVNDKNILKPEAIQQHDERALAEHHRLWYVALTRASYRVYAMMQDDAGKSTTGLAFWRGHPAQSFQHVGCVVEDLLTQRPVALKAKVIENFEAIEAMPLPNMRFYSKTKTSFSALAQHLTRQQIQDALAVTEPSSAVAEDESYIHPRIKTAQQATVPIAWIKDNFPMGTTAGTFLHKIFEHLDFQNPETWGTELKRRFANEDQKLKDELLEKYQKVFAEPQDEKDIEPILIQMMQDWLLDVLDTPILDDFKLKKLNHTQRLAEFPFHLALADRVLTIQRIHALFAEYDIQMPEFKDAFAARYLKGEIDLVFYDGQKFHIADYKSNYLGADQQQYSSTAIQESMSFASYWLQAALYLVALHRYLSVKLENYQIDQHLGGASYLYLRGMNGQEGQGYHYWRPSSEFILRLDAILGYFAEDKLSNIA
ncbi:exonuclease V subunit beta [Acinetobacter defluvii]|uniref:UvrD-helicase domain-containing protein n=1 Tax=Acinetobacter defluvii TaxID=1871111 RepID=UPI00148FF9B1|nr:UvrD-helicase domain-containing protein [Acinetobacter defluvii]NNP71955.1 exonuclease V subunit beta [Acinetobacter defluvii]